MKWHGQFQLGVENEFLKIKILLQDAQNEQAWELLKKYDDKKLEKIELTNFYVLKAQYLYNTKKFQESLNVIDEYVKVATPDALTFQIICFKIQLS